MHNNICKALSTVPSTEHHVGCCYCHYHRDEGWRKLGVWIPNMTCAVWLWKMSETPLCPWRIERSGLTGEGTKEIEIVFFFF